MVIVHRGHIGRKASGGMFRSVSARRKCDTGRKPAHTLIGTRRVDAIRTKCAGRKNRLVVCETANLFNPTTKTFVQAKVKTVKESAASRHFIRRNIITKGAVIETDAGLAKVTSRPGQDGAINAILIVK